MHRPEERQEAVDLFNHVWTLIELPERTPEQDDEMIHAAHASRHHWAAVGTGVNLSGAWRVADLARLRHARPRRAGALPRGALPRVLRGERGCIADWDLPFAYEALARAHMTAGNREEAERHVARARELASQVADEHDREHLEEELTTLP